MSDSLQPHGLQHTRPPCPSSTPGVYSNSCPLSWWCHPTISSSVVPFSYHLQSFPASGSFQMSQFFTSGGQSIGVLASASVLPMNIQDWFQSQRKAMPFLQGVGNGQGSLGCYSPWGHIELDMTEWLSWTEMDSLPLSHQGSLGIIENP